MPTLTLTQHNFNATIAAHPIVLVDWWAAWCGPCHHFAPVFEASAEQHPDIVHGKVDTEAEPALTASAGVDRLPTLMAFRDGLLVFSQPGYLASTALEDIVQQVRWLDMDQIRREMQQIAQQQAPSPEPAVSGGGSRARQAGVAGNASYGWPGL